MASNLKAMASNLVAMAPNLQAMASNLLATAEWNLRGVPCRQIPRIRSPRPGARHRWRSCSRSLHHPSTKKAHIGLQYIQMSHTVFSRTGGSSRIGARSLVMPPNHPKENRIARDLLRGSTAVTYSQDPDARPCRCEVCLQVLGHGAREGRAFQQIHMK